MKITNFFSLLPRRWRNQLCRIYFWYSIWKFYTHILLKYELWLIFIKPFCFQRNIFLHYLIFWARGVLSFPIFYLFSQHPFKCLISFWAFITLICFFFFACFFYWTPYSVHYFYPISWACIFKNLFFYVFILSIHCFSYRPIYWTSIFLLLFFFMD